MQLSKLIMDECDASFKLIKDPSKEIRIEADASNYGVGGVISHVM